MGVRAESITFCLIQKRSSKGMPLLQMNARKFFSRYRIPIIHRTPINGTLVEVNMVTEIKLGLCNPPEPIYLYVKNAELGGESYLWYNYDIDREKTTPVPQRALTGYLSELRLTTKEF
jgi:hypothetical protein